MVGPAGAVESMGRGVQRLSADSASGGDFFGGVYRGPRVLLTGHTGFKGSWLLYWLSRLGADVTGVALDPPSEPSHYALLDVPHRSIRCDIRDRAALARIVTETQPEFVFHLAAQSLVRKSYADPIGTLETNVLGTANLLEACRGCESLRAVVSVTSDKVYENREWYWGYREDDPLGGHDLYSCSKGAAELVTAAYRRCFFPAERHGSEHQALVASARAGNVIGGGDWAADRLVPDMARAAGAGQTVVVRSPRSTRPWQYVLESLSGYLVLGARLFAGDRSAARGWNFGPADDDNVNVLSLVQEMRRHWPRLEYRIEEDANAVHEAGRLALDSSLARGRLSWRPVWHWRRAVEMSARWYRAYYESGRVETAAVLDAYLADAARAGVVWCPT